MFFIISHNDDHSFQVESVFLSERLGLCSNSQEDFSLCIKGSRVVEHQYQGHCLPVNLLRTDESSKKLILGTLEDSSNSIWNSRKNSLCSELLSRWNNWCGNEGEKKRCRGMLFKAKSLHKPHNWLRKKMIQEIHESDRGKLCGKKGYMNGYFNILCDV